MISNRKVIKPSLKINMNIGMRCRILLPRPRAVFVLCPTRGPGWSWRMECCTVIKNRCCGPETAAAAGILVQLTRNVVININI